MKGKYVGTYRVRAHDVSEDKLIHLPAFIRILQDASLQHAIHLGVSIWDPSMENTSWVLIKKEINISSYPPLNTTIKVETYPSSFDKFFAYRDWIAYDESNTIIATAKSQWAVIDLSTRRMARLPEHLLSITLPEENLGQPNVKIELNNEPLSQTSFNINRYDLDWNGHLNNSKLIEYMLASIPQEQFEGNYNSIKIIFKSEMLLGDTLRVDYYHEDGKEKLKATNLRENTLVALIEVERDK